MELLVLVENHVVAAQLWHAFIKIGSHMETEVECFSSIPDDLKGIEVYKSLFSYKDVEVFWKLPTKQVQEKCIFLWVLFCSLNEALLIGVSPRSVKMVEKFKLTGRFSVRFEGKH